MGRENGRKRKPKTTGKTTTKRAVVESAPPVLIPQPNGGALRSGGTPGNAGGTGRPPHIIREGFRRRLPSEARKLREHVEKIEAHVVALEPIREGEKEEAARLTQQIFDLERLMRARMQLADFYARYGLGTTTTQTDTKGADASAPGRLTTEQRREEVVRLLMGGN